MQLLNCQNENKVEKNGENMSNIHNIIIAGAGIMGSSIVGDLKQILPKLADAVRKYKAEKANS